MMCQNFKNKRLKIKNLGLLEKFDVSASQKCHLNMAIGFGKHWLGCKKYGARDQEST